MTTRVSAPSRLHFGLLDLSHATAMRYGGVGVTLSAPRAVIEACPAGKLVISGEAPDHILETVASALMGPLTNELASEVRIVQAPPFHLGFGATTSVVLSAIVAVLACHGRPVTTEEVILASGRGATSGVGVNGFFHPGLVVDHGRVDVPGEPLMPSERAPTKFKPAGLTTRIPFPAGWPIALIKPQGERALSIDEEIAAFSEISPIAEEDSLRAIALTYHGIIPAVLSSSFRMFRTALHELQDTGFKSAEIGLRGNNVQSLLRRLRSRDEIAAGMSSFGPIVFAVLQNEQSKSLAHHIARASAADIMEWTSADNVGYVVRVEG